MQSRYLIGTLFEQQQQTKKMNINTTKIKDPMGNIRWKGAFTGGFEAGYKNTCGSKYGWLPTSFISSIGNRFQQKQQHIFDFMDQQDYGKSIIGSNISINNNFHQQPSNPFAITLQQQSMGNQILAKTKKKFAFVNAPENVQELHQLLQNYQEEEQLFQNTQNYNLRGLQGYNSVGATQQIPNDDFILAYDDYFRKVIRVSVRQQTQQQLAKRKQQNKLYFNFTIPLDNQPQYLKQIHQIQQLSQPKKRRKNILSDNSLKTIFHLESIHLKIQQQPINIIQNIPDDYDPFHRLKNIKDQQSTFVILASSQSKHKIWNLNKRTDLLNQNKLSNKFVAATNTIPSSNKFVREGQEQHLKELQKIFDDEQKNKRYWDYVLQLQGKKISAQMQYQSYEQAQQQKQQFQAIYQLKNLPQKTIQQEKPLSKKPVQKILTPQIKVTRKTGFWKPQKILCTRFGCMLPYKQENTYKIK